MGQNLPCTLVPYRQRFFYTQRPPILIKIKVFKGFGGSYKCIILEIGLPIVTVVNSPIVTMLWIALKGGQRGQGVYLSALCSFQDPP